MYATDSSDFSQVQNSEDSIVCRSGCSIAILAYHMLQLAGHRIDADSLLVQDAVAEMRKVQTSSN